MNSNKISSPQFLFQTF